MHNLDIFLVNDTYSIISGGSTGDPNVYDEDFTLKSTWFYNHVTQTFHQGPDLKNTRYGHVSGSLKYGSQEVQIVAGGVSFEMLDTSNKECYGSVEILVNGQWKEGPSLSKDGHFCVNFNMVSYEGDVYAIGVKYKKRISKTNFFEIHKLSCPKEECKWTRIKKEEIKGRYRRNFVVIPVNDSF